MKINKIIMQGTLVLITFIYYNNNMRRKINMKKILVTDEILKLWGVHGSANKEMLRFLIKDEKSLLEFMEEFYDGDILRNMMAYQKHKRSMNGMTKEEFIIGCSDDIQKALEIVFQEPINLAHTRYMDLYNITYNDLYEKFKKFPNRSFLNLVKSEKSLSNKPKNDNFMLVL